MEHHEGRLVNSGNAGQFDPNPKELRDYKERIEIYFMISLKENVYEQKLRRSREITKDEENALNFSGIIERFVYGQLKQWAKPKKIFPKMNQQRRWQVAIFIGALIVLLYRYSSYGDASLLHSESLLLKSNFDTCLLKVPDPFDPVVMRAIEVLKDPNEGCEKVPPTTTLHNGTVTYHQQGIGVTCEGRCVLLKDHWTLDLKEFTDIKTTHYPCDVVEVVCKDQKNDIIHENLQKQIYEHERERKEVFGDQFVPTNSPKVTDGNYHPNVFVIVIDSSSTNTGYRSFWRSLTFLRTQFEAVEYNFHNKAGDNSWPNAQAFMFGNIAETIDLNVFGENKIIPKDRDLCEKRLDREPLMMYEYEDAGYKTMYATNAGFLAFANNGNCKGVLNQIATHYMRPFNLDRMKTPDFETKWESFDSKKCHSIPRNLFDYNQKFLNSYAGKSKMSVIWDVEIAHNHEKVAHYADPFMLEFFERNQQMLDDSFIFFMADHGGRFGKVAQTPQGLYNRHNPMLHISIPRQLRGSKMHEVMRKQSTLLSTHHDLYATFLDIARYQPLSNFTDTLYRKIEGSRGSSFLREYETGKARNCKTLPIPPHYCICKFQSEDEAPEFVKEKIAKVAVDELNRFVKENNVDDICEEWSLDKVQALVVKPQMKYKKAYEVVFRTKDPKGVFAAQVGERHNGVLSMVERKWDRIDAYGNTASCLSKEQYNLQQMCYCKKQS